MAVKNFIADAEIGAAIQGYRDHIESALAWSNELSDKGVERPWITVRCRREECSTSVVFSETGREGAEHTHRIRLEIR